MFYRNFALQYPSLNKKDIYRFLKSVFIIYVLAGTGLFFFQEKLLFHPKKLAADYKFDFNIPYREWNLPRADSSNLNLVQFLPPDSTPTGIVIYYHGNMRNITRYAPFMRLFTMNGYEVWMMDYPGFGKSTGKRNEQTLYDDAERVYRMAAAKVNADSIIIYGKSIGTGIAANIASRFPCRRLVLETPYTSIPGLAQRYFFMYPVKYMVKYQFPSIDYLAKVKAPITIFHGTNDEVIPYRNARRLLTVLKPGDEFVTIEKATHNNIPDFQLYHDKMDSLLELTK
jgi:uncharacterized protein